MPRNYTLITLLFPFFFFTANGQETSLPQDNPIAYYNGFQNYRNNNADSALFCLRKLAANSDYSSFVEELVHNFFAYSFRKTREGKTKKQETAHAILAAMLVDDNRDLRKAARPISYWVQVQDENDDQRLSELVIEFRKSYLSGDDIYLNKAGRYAILIYQEIAPKKSMQTLADQLLSQLTDKLKQGQLKADPETSPRPLLSKRAWYRYLYAYVNFVQGNALLSANKINEAGAYLKTAFDYSPDLSDYNVQSGFYYDMSFILGKQKLTFQDD